MKKILSLVICVMLVAFCAAGLAEEVYTVEIDYEGYYVTFDELFDLYLPETFVDTEVTDDMAENGTFAFYIDSETGMAMTVQWVYGEGTNDINAMYEYMASSGEYANADIMSFNSVDFVVYEDPENSAFGCLCSDGEEDGGYYIFNFAPDDEETSILAVKIMSSISEP
ncbi:MAG: hypothetical protein Q4D04_05360 [Clostridia bacterium]|nr:hypothetical protein [Clostridia bacterium]